MSVNSTQFWNEAKSRLSPDAYRFLLQLQGNIDQLTIDCDVLREGALQANLEVGNQMALRDDARVETARHCANLLVMVKEAEQAHAALRLAKKALVNIHCQDCCCDGVGSGQCEVDCPRRTALEAIDKVQP